MNEKDEELKKAETETETETEQNDEVEAEGGTHTPNSETDNTKASVEGSEETHGLNETHEKETRGPENEVGPREPSEKTFTQSQVNELVGRVRQEAREAAMKQLLERYGVDTEDNLNTMFGNGQRYELLDENYRGLETRYGDAMTENALLKSQIVPGRWDDVKAILNSKGLEITPDNIAVEMQTHPEWKGEEEAIPTPAISKIDKLGDDTLETQEQESDYDLAMRLMGVSRQ